MKYQDVGQRTVYLADYLSRASKRLLTVARDKIALGIGWFAGFCALAFAMDGNHSQPSAALFASIAVLGGAYFIIRAFLATNIKDADQALRSRTARTSRHMLNAIEKRTLHRDLGDPTVVVLEECARQWSRINLTLNNPYWSSPTLNIPYRNARDNALSSAEYCMTDLILLFEQHYVRGARERKPGEWLDDVLAEFALKAPRPSHFVPVGFDRAREMADHLRQLADKVDEMSIAATSNFSANQQMTASSSAMEHALSELKQLQVAEEELRQNLGE